MKKYCTFATLSVIIIALTACGVPVKTPPTETPVSDATATVTQTDAPYDGTPAETPTAAQTGTGAPTVTNTLTLTPDYGDTPTQIAQEKNLFTNPGCEDGFEVVEVCDGDLCVDHFVCKGWNPVYCDYPYWFEGCPAERKPNGDPYGYIEGEFTEDGNPVGNDPELMMGRPEYKAMCSETDEACQGVFEERVNSGKYAQSWFLYSRVGYAGVYQTVDTVPGQICMVWASVQSWSNSDNDSPSELDSEDDRINSGWTIRVGLGGENQVLTDDMLISKVFGYEHGEPTGIYDKYQIISYIFTANSYRTTVAFLDLRVFPIPNNDSYLDDAYITCE